MTDQQADTKTPGPPRKAIVDWGVGMLVVAGVAKRKANSYLFVGYSAREQQLMK